MRHIRRRARLKRRKLLLDIGTQQECFRNVPTARESFPNSDLAALQSLAIPIYPELTPTQRAARPTAAAPAACWLVVRTKPRMSAPERT